MKALLSTGLWDELVAYRREARVRFLGAIAYVTANPLGLGEGDTLICDASPESIRQGATSARVLASMLRNGAQLYSLPSLHSKVCVVGDRAFVGSANMSAGAAVKSVEAGVWTDDTQIYASTRTFIENVRRRASRVNRDAIEHLLELPVRQRRHELPYTGSGAPFIAAISSRTWWISTHDLSESIIAAEQDIEHRGMQRALRRRFLTDYDIESIRWVGRSAFMREAKRGDRIVDAHWAGAGRGEAVIYPPSTLLHKEEGSRSTYFYVEFRGDREPLPWRTLRPHLASLGMTGWSPGTSREVTGKLGALVSIIEALTHA